MSERPARRLFLERASYLRRRMADAAFLLPILGAFLFLAPLLWPMPSPDPGPAPAPIPMSSAMFYVFGAWGALILAAVVMAYRVRRLAPTQTESDRR